MNIEDLYTPEEIANKLKITKYTVYEMIKRGDLDAHRLGKQLRISGDQFNQYLQRAKGSSNIYEAEIKADGDIVTALVDNININVNTELRGKVKVSVHPDDILLSKEPIHTSANNNYKGSVVNIMDEGTSVKVTLDIGITISAIITKKSFTSMNIEKGKNLYVIFKTMSVKVYK
ncbi:MAG: helix-turn-helix domain-containing protein [Firmicutes bacterium]|nr:helix-turn-helix domain-containing protein [Bacillota bacterium]